MKKIAILNCLKANQNCSGNGCFKALNERSGGFEPYKDEEVEVTAFTRCSNCGKTTDEDEGMKKKLDRIADVGTETVHIGVCARAKDGTHCRFMQSHADYRESRGVEVIWKTHAAH